MDLTVLKQIGLTDSEIKTYFALLELEVSTVGPIIDKAKVPDSKIYIILDKLKEKGLASFVVKNNVKHYQASNPKNLLRILSEKEEAIAKQRKELREEVIPEIEKRRKLTEDKQEATVYESYQGLKSAFSYLIGTLQKGDSYDVFAFGEELSEQRVISFFREYHKKRREKGVKLRLLFPQKYRQEAEAHHIYPGMNIKYSETTYPTGLYVFKNHVMTVVWGEKPAAFIVKSKINHDQHKAFFEELWKKAEK